MTIRDLINALDAQGQRIGFLAPVVLYEKNHEDEGGWVYDVDLTVRDLRTEGRYAPALQPKHPSRRKYPVVQGVVLHVDADDAFDRADLP